MLGLHKGEREKASVKRPTYNIKKCTRNRLRGEHPSRGGKKGQMDPPATWSWDGKRKKTPLGPGTGNRVG